jgi:4-oxalocrotonate tautomerase
VKLWPGKSDLQRQKLAAEITKPVMDTLHYGEESVSVAFEEGAAKIGWRRCMRPTSG